MADLARQRLIAHLQAILDAPEMTGKALQAKAQAARTLALLTGALKPATRPTYEEELEELPPDPIAAAGLDELAPRRTKGSRG